MSRDARKPVIWVSDQVVTNRAALLLNMASDLKFRTEEVHVLYYSVGRDVTKIARAIFVPKLIFLL